VRRLTPLVAVLAIAALVPACTVEPRPTAGVRTTPRGRAEILAPPCGDERIVAVQVADLDGPVRWRAEGGGNSGQSTFVVGAEPQLMQVTDPLEGSLDPDDAYVATLEYAGSLPDVEVEFRTSSLSTDRVADADGDVVTLQSFSDEADLECVGPWLWIFGGVAIALVLGVLAAFVVGLIIVVKVVRKARRQREQEATPGRPDLSGR
jgi:hypothetical protein